MKKLTVVIVSLLLVFILSSCASFKSAFDELAIKEEIRRQEKEIDSLKNSISELENKDERYFEFLDRLDYIETEVMKGNVYVTHYESTETGFFFKRNQIISGESGSGIVLKIDGNYAYILTNNHVISTSSEETSDKIYVYDVNGNKHDATIVSEDPSYDMALLRIRTNQNSNLRVMELAEENPEKGSMVYAIGAPFGQKNSVGIGNVVQYQKNTYTSTDSKIDYQIIIHDAYMNHGNSGGMLIDDEFKVVGINTLGSSENDYEYSMNGASPVEKIKEFLNGISFDWRKYD